MECKAGPSASLASHVGNRFLFWEAFYHSALYYHFMSASAEVIESFNYQAHGKLLCTGEWLNTSAGKDYKVRLFIRLRGVGNTCTCSHDTSTYKYRDISVATRFDSCHSRVLWSLFQVLSKWLLGAPEVWPRLQFWPQSSVAQLSTSFIQSYKVFTIFFTPSEVAHKYFPC